METSDVGTERVQHSVMEISQGNGECLTRNAARPPHVAAWDNHNRATLHDVTGGHHAMVLP